MQCCFEVYGKSYYMGPERLSKRYSDTPVDPNLSFDLVKKQLEQDISEGKIRSSLWLVNEYIIVHLTRYEWSTWGHYNIAKLIVSLQIPNFGGYMRTLLYISYVYIITHLPSPMSVCIRTLLYTLREYIIANWPDLIKFKYCKLLMNALFYTFTMHIRILIIDYSYIGYTST